MEGRPFLQQKSLEEKTQNQKNFELFYPEILVSVHTVSELIASGDFEKRELHHSKQKGKKISEQDGVILSTPSARPAKHGTVVFVDIEKENKNFSAVIKNHTSGYDSYVENIKKAPAIKEYLPEVYGKVSGWVVMERLHGLELSKLELALEQNEALVEKFSKCSVDFLYTTATNNFVTQDVSLMAGHNCIIDPDTGKIKLIEVDNLEKYDPREYGPVPDFSPNELFTRELMDEIGRLAKSPYEMENFIKDWRLDMVLSLLQRATQKVHSEDLQIKYRYVLPSHPSFRESYSEYMHVQKKYKPFQDITDEEYATITQNEPMLMVPHYNHRLQGICFNQDLLRSIENGDIVGLKKLLFKDGVTRESLISKITDTPENRIILK